ncbi:MAG: DUF4399 domain-containing protein, partial [Moraxellaceae bacterium]
TITKRDRRALAPDTQIEVTVADVSMADAPAKVLGRQTFSSDDKQVPLQFSVALKGGDIKANRRYALMVRVTEGGKLTYITDTHIPVTPENWNTKFEVNIVPVGGEHANHNHGGHHHHDAKAGHFHLLTDVESLPSHDRPMPANANIKHLTEGQTETQLTLNPGKHTLQLVLGDSSHMTGAEPIASKKITIIVK